MNNERYVARGEVAVLYLFKPPLGVAQGLCKETCFPRVLMSAGQVALKYDCPSCLYSGINTAR